MDKRMGWIVIVLLSAACHAPVTVPPRLLTGTLAFESRAIASTVGAIASGAAVSLIDATSGKTVATTLSSLQGQFTLYLPSGFEPEPGRLYLVEAAKGLGAGAAPNRAGTPVARLRTMLFFGADDWHSLGETGSGLRLGWDTTALCVIAGLKGLDAVQQRGLLGHLQAGSYDPAGTAVGLLEFVEVGALIREALAAEQDPVAAIAYDPSSSHYARRALSLSLDPVTMATASVGSTLVLAGTHLPAPGSGATLWLGNRACNWTTSPDGQRLTVAMPEGARSAPLSLNVGSTRLAGPFVRLLRTLGSFAGDGLAGFGDGPAAAARFSNPRGLAALGDGSFVVADTGNHALRRVTPDGWVSTLAGGSPGWADGPLDTARFHSPAAVARGPEGSLWVADQDNHALRRLWPSGQVTTVDLSAVGGVNYPQGVAVASDGTVVLADTGDNRLVWIPPSGPLRTTEMIQQPRGLAFDAAGNLLVCEDMGLSRIDSEGACTMLANFWQPMAVAIDAQGRALVSVPTDRKVVRLVAGGGTEDLLVGQDPVGPPPGPPGDPPPPGGPPAPEQGLTLRNPAGLAVDALGGVWIVDSNGQRLLVFDP